MKVALIHNALLPAKHYGGTERVIYWLSKGLTKLGCEVTLVCQKGSIAPFAKIRAFDFSQSQENALNGYELYHYFSTPKNHPTHPYIVTIGGNGKLGEKFLKNTVFVSQNHAQRHRSTSFIHNGIDPDDYLYSETKKDELIFLAKASWKVKNVRGAISIAKKARKKLNIVGSRRNFSFPFSFVRWKGSLGGNQKAVLLKDASALLFPVIWNEPFGLAVAEAFMSGSPVIASRRGSLPELVHKDVGTLCETEFEFFEAIKNLETFNPSRCRDWAMENFHYIKMSKTYLSLYERVLGGESLNPIEPEATESPEKILPIA